MKGKGSVWFNGVAKLKYITLTQEVCCPCEGRSVPIISRRVKEIIIRFEVYSIIQEQLYDIGVL